MKKNLLWLCAATLLYTCSWAQTDNRLMFLSKKITVEPNLQQFTNEVINPDEIFNGYYYRFVQFNNIPSAATKLALENTGIKILDYMPYKAFMMAIPVNYNRSQLANFDVRCIINQTLDQKRSLHMFGDAPAYAVKEKGYVDVRVQYQKNIVFATALHEATRFGKILNTTELTRMIEIRVKKTDIEQLTAQAWLYFIDVIAPPSIKDDTKGRSLHRSNVINTDMPMGRHYNGNGVGAALADDGIVGPHIDFTGRLTNHGTVTGGFHGDMTAGILAGAGNLNPMYRGMADGVDLHVFDIGGYPQIIDAVTNNATLGTVVSSTSYSQGCNEYTTDTQFGDQTIHDNTQLEFVFSAGNNNGADCGYGAGGNWGNITGGYKQGKNVIACANLDALEVIDPSSSIGPASDGRIKPDISSNGRDQMSTEENNSYQVGGGTSAACPGIAGICTQLIQAYKELNSATNAPTALIKASLLNSAEDIGNAGPDFKFGWGRVNALRAVTTLEDNRYTTGTLAQGGTSSYSITVPANVKQMRVMLYWHDQGGNPAAAISLINDLDMTITDPSAFNWEPWILDPTPNAVNLNTPAIRGADHLNNMEQVTIDNPAAGTYTVNLNGFSVPQGPQEYYLVYEFRMDDITVTYPMGGEGFVPGEAEVIRWDALKGLGNFTLEYSIDNGSNWTIITTAVNQNTLQYTWTVPNTITGEALVRVSHGTVSGVSANKFSIVGTPANIVVDWACIDSLQLSWTAVNGASWYEVSQLGVSHMDSVGITTATSIVLAGINPLTEHWFSVRAVMPNGVKGRRAIAINKQPGNINCVLALDVQTSTILSPANGIIQDCQNVTSTPVSILINNLGTTPVGAIPVFYSLNGASPVSETFSGTINPGTSVIYTFSAPINISIAGTYSIKAWSGFAGDQNSFNDSAASSVSVIAGVTEPLPYIENFDAFTNCVTANNCEATICNFGDWINELNLSQDDIDFRVNSGNTPSVDTGPSADHTLGTNAGKYVYLEASACFAKTSNLISPCVDLNAATNPVMTFWYHMYGVDMGTLHVDVFANGIWNNDAWVLSGDQGNSWQQATISLSSYVGQNINIRFRGVTGANFASDLAIDDININSTTGLKDIATNDGSVVITPNPSNGVFTVNYVYPTSATLNYNVTDAKGSLILQGTFDHGNKKAVLDLSNYDKGVYMITISSANKVTKHKLVIM